MSSPSLLALLSLLSVFSFLAPQAAVARQFTLVIDAGHGGKDPGALGKYSKEKTINLNVALAFGRYVEQNCPDVKVVYTRKTDIFIPLHERAAIANRNKADVFISIHTNSVTSSRSIAGLETYTMGMRRSDEKLSAAMRENDVVLIEDNYRQHYSGFDPRSPESYIIFEMINDANMLESVNLAKKIQRKVCRTANRPDKGVKQDAFLVLRETSMPACLIELGYITTPSEENYLNNKANIDALGRGIYQAFVEYKNEKTGSKRPTPDPSLRGRGEDRSAADKPAPEKPSGTKADEKTNYPPPSQGWAGGGSVGAGDESAGGGSVGAGGESAGSVPLFKVQFLTSDRKLKATDKRLKDMKDTECYKEGGLWKYTVGNTADYDEIRRLRRQVAKKFPQAFIAAFRDGQRMDLDEAIAEARKNKQ